MDSLEHHDPKLKSKTVLDERFEILSVFSESGTATLYHGHHLLLDKSVIIKVLHDQCKESASFQRFQREITALSKLSHANIVTAYATGIHDNRPYLVTEEMDGVTLAELFAQQVPSNGSLEQSLDLESKRSIVCQICDALAHLHSHGIVHRDLRPENVLISKDGQYVKLKDFEFAKFSANKNEMRVTQKGEMIGSASYASPEQLGGGTVDARSDLFSLGCLIYELFTAEPPLKDGIPFAVSPERQPALSNKLDGQLQKCVDKLLQKQPSQRYGSAAELKAAISKTKLHPASSSRNTIFITGTVVLALAGAGHVSMNLQTERGNKIPEKTERADSKTSSLFGDQRFIPVVGRAINATNEGDVETTHSLALSILEALHTLKPTESKLKTLRTFVETLQQRQFYDLEQQISEAAAEFVLRADSPKRSEWAFYKLSEATALKATDQAETSIIYFNKLLASPFAKKYPDNLPIVHSKQELASSLESVVIASPADARNTKRRKQIDELMQELNDSPAQKNGEWESVIKLANHQYKEFLSKPRSFLYYTDLEDFLQTAAIQLENSRDIEKTNLQLVKSARGPVFRGYLFNLVRLMKASELIRQGTLAEAEPLARTSQDYFIRRPYSETVNHELGHLDQAYIAKGQFASGRAVIDTRIALVNKNPHKDSDDNMLECHYAKGICFENEKRYSDAEREFQKALSTTFAKARPTDKHALKAELSLARIMWNKGDKTSKEEAIILLQKIANKRNLVEEDATTKSSASTALNIINQASELLVEYKSKGEQSSQKRP